MNLSNGTYDVLKKLCTTFIPAAITCFIVVAGALQVSSEIIETVATIVGAVNTFIGVCLGISTNNYWTDKTVVAQKPTEGV